MLLTRSIRRKLVSVLALVLTMLATLSIAGISGLKSYRDVVRSLEFNMHEAPQPVELAARMSELADPLLDPQDPRSTLRVPTPGAARRQRQEFAQRLERARDEVNEFRRRLQELPPQRNRVFRGPYIWELLGGIDRELDALEQLEKRLGDPDTAEAVSAAMLPRIVSLGRYAHRIPESSAGLHETLENAHKVYESRLTLVCAATAVVVVLFIGLVHCGYRWIFHPIRALHQGARRVAQGDFDYRVELKSRDEMAELAESFNQMTARFQEITEDLDRKVRERSRQLVRSERLAGVGFLAAGVAHEINNPLSAISMAAESLQDRMSGLLNTCEKADRDVVAQYLKMIQSESERCQGITSRLLDFSRGQDTTREECDLTAIVNEVTTLVGHMSKYRDRTVEFSRHAPCRAVVNAAEIKQVVLNLVANALDALPPGGAVEIDIAEKTDDVHIAFRDNGSGMTAETIAHLFEPFYTTKSPGSGTGLGLSISHRIVSDHGGTIEATSPGPGRGSCFRVHLPRRPRVAKSAA